MRWSGWPVHQLSTHGSRCRKCGGAPHGWCGSSSCEEDRNPQPTFLGLNLNLKMVWRAVKLATGCFHFFHQSSGSPGVLGVPESWESRESRSLGSLGSPGVSNCKLYLCPKVFNNHQCHRLPFFPVFLPPQVSVSAVRSRSAWAT